MAGARTKGVSLAGLQGFDTARRIESESRASSERALYSLGAGGRRLFDQGREESHRREDKAERIGLRADAQKERDSDDAESKRRFDAEFGLRKEQIDVAARRQRDTGALSFFKERYVEAVGDVERVMAAGAANPETRASEAWVKARDQAVGRVRDLQGKMGQVQSRLSGLPPEETDTGERVLAEFDTDAGPVKVDASTPEGRIVGLQANVRRLQTLRDKAKGTAAAVLYGTQLGQAEAELGLAKRGAREGKRHADQQRKDALEESQGKATLQDLGGAIERARAAGVPEEVLAGVQGRVVAKGKDRMTWAQAQRILNDAMQATPGAVTSKAVTREQAEAAGKSATGQETDAEQERRVALQKKVKDMEHAGEAGAKADADAIKRFTDEMDRTEPDPDNIRGGTRTGTPRMDRLKFADAQRIVNRAKDRPGTIEPAVLALAEKRMQHARETGEYQDKPSSQPSGSGSIQVWERGPDGKPRRVK